MKICMITPMMPPDQAAVSILPYLLGESFTQSKFKIYYITFYPRDFNNILNSNKIKYITNFTKQHRILNKLKIANLLIVLSFIISAKKIIKEVDIVHIHSYTQLTYGGIILAKLFKKPVVITLYGTEIWSYRPKKYFDLFKTIINKYIDYVVFYSKGMMEYANNIGIIPEKQTYIHPPIRKEFKILNNANQLKNKLGMIYENNLLNVKDPYPVGGHEYLVKAMAIVCKKFPDTCLFICGDGPLKNELIKLSKELNLQDNIKFMGIIPNTSLVEYYNAADLFVLSSVLESFGAIIIESLACGTKVVATNTVGAIELNKLFPDAISLAENKNPQSIAQAIIEQLNNKQKMPLVATQKVQEIFSLKNVAEKYLKTYQQIKN